MKSIYIRTSTNEQTPELQLRDLSKIIDIDECKIYKDLQSAYQDFKEREFFVLLKSEIIKKKVSDLYVWDLDRLFRNRKKLIAFFELCKNYNCKIHSYRQNWLEQINSMPEPWNEIIHNLMLQIMGWLAEEESSKKSERIKNAVVKKVGSKTKSYKGNTWGRKSLSKQTITKVLDLSNQGLSIRKICDLIWIYDDNGNKKKNISRGAVHKIVSQNLH